MIQPKSMISSFYMSRANYSLAVGNVLVVVSDRKKGTTDNGSSVYVPEIVSYSDYSLFGTQLHLRHGSSEAYRYGFQGQERDDEIKGEGNSYTAEFWQYDSRLGRRWNIDPVVKFHESPYAAFANNPIWFRDPNGADTNLYELNSGNFIDKKVSDSKKTPIWVVDETSKKYDPKNPWKTAYPLKYDVGNADDKKAGKKTGISGDSFRKEHPLYREKKRGKGEFAMPYKGQVYMEDLMTISPSSFKNIIGYGIPVMVNMQFNWGGWAKTLAMWSYWDDDAIFDLKSTITTDGTPSYAAIVISE